MTPNETTGLVVGLAMALFFFGGLIAILYSRSKSPEMKRFAVRAGIANLCGVTAFIAILFYLNANAPKWDWVPWAFYPFILVANVKYLN